MNFGKDKIGIQAGRRGVEIHVVSFKSYGLEGDLKIAFDFSGWLFDTALRRAVKKANKLGGEVAPILCLVEESVSDGQACAQVQHRSFAADSEAMAWGVTYLQTPDLLGTC